MREGSAAVAFDLIEHDGDDLRDLPLIDRKRRLARLIGRAKHGVKDAAPPGSSPDRNGRDFVVSVVSGTSGAMLIER